MALSISGVGDNGAYASPSPAGACGVPATAAGAVASGAFVSASGAAFLPGPSCAHPNVTNAANTAKEYVSDFVIPKFTLWKGPISRDIVSLRGVMSELVEGARLEIV